MLSTTELINGVSVLLAFYVGYRYGLRISKEKKEKDDPSSSKLAKDSSVVGSLFSSQGNYKMVLVVRNDLKMGKGKIAAQCGHGAVGAYERAMRIAPNLVRMWNTTGCAKIAVKVESEAALMDISSKAKNLNLNTCLVRDAGHTQVEPNTKTVLAIGPDEVYKIDKVTRHLKLL